MADQALSDDTTAHDITRNPESIWLSPICDDTAHHGEGRTWAAPAPDETCEDCSEPWVEYVRSDLASVSSASAEGEVGTGWVAWNPDTGEEYTPNHPVQSGECVEAEHIRRSTPQEDTLWNGMQEQFMRAEALAAAAVASPEPVPATNQAGEVERRSRALIETIARADPREGSAIIYDGEIAGEWEHEARAILALATQPATSQETDWESQANRLDRIRDDGGPLTLSDKAVLRETAQLMRSATPPPGCPECGFNTCMCDGSPNNPDTAQPATSQEGEAAVPMSDALDTVVDILRDEFGSPTAQAVRTADKILLALDRDNPVDRNLLTARGLSRLLTDVAQLSVKAGAMGATSQEGEGCNCILSNRTGDPVGGPCSSCLARAATPTPPTLSEDLRAAIAKLIDRADAMPKKTPAPGGCATKHQFTIEAGTIWSLDTAVTEARAALAQVKAS